MEKETLPRYGPATTPKARPAAPEAAESPDCTPLYTHRDLERLLKGYNQAYNARPQRVLKGRAPDDVVRARLADAPKLANPRHKPPDPGVMAEAMRAVESAKEVS